MFWFDLFFLCWETICSIEETFFFKQLNRCLALWCRHYVCQGMAKTISMSSNPPRVTSVLPVPHLILRWTVNYLCQTAYCNKNIRHTYKKMKQDWIQGVGSTVQPLNIFPFWTFHRYVIVFPCHQFLPVSVPDIGVTIYEQWTKFGSIGADITCLFSGNWDRLKVTASSRSDNTKRYRFLFPFKNRYRPCSVSLKVSHNLFNALKMTFLFAQPVIKVLISGFWTTFFTLRNAIYPLISTSFQKIILVNVSEFTTGCHFSKWNDRKGKVRHTLVENVGTAGLRFYDF